MTMRSHLAVLAALALIGAGTPAFAQTVPADANKALWCSAAFTIVAPQAKAQGQAAAADNFTKYSGTLASMASDSMKKAGFTDDAIKTQGTSYADKVSKELSGAGTAEFSVVDCTQLVDPVAAASIQSATTPPAAAPAAPAAPAAGDTTTPAPAAK